ncbi:MAG: hypothetical protein PF448_06710 [Bacteroidales bacterium]|jgi:hypothetical protein|nr:hypothetical protein [Bacteroidales bacterium]
MTDYIAIIRKHLKIIRYWSVFLTMIGFLWTAGSIVFAIIFYGAQDNLYIYKSFDISDLLFAFALINAMLAFFPAFILSLFAVNLKRYQISSENEDFEHAVFYLKSLFVYLGSFAILLMIIVLLQVLNLVDFSFLL